MTNATVWSSNDLPSHLLQDKSRSHQFHPRVLPGIFKGYLTALPSASGDFVPHVFKELGNNVADERVINLVPLNSIPKPTFTKSLPDIWLQTSNFWWIHKEFPQVIFKLKSFLRLHHSVIGRKAPGLKSVPILVIRQKPCRGYEKSNRLDTLMSSRTRIPFWEELSELRRARRNNCSRMEKDVTRLQLQAESLLERTTSAKRKIDSDLAGRLFT